MCHAKDMSARVIISGEPKGRGSYPMSSPCNTALLSMTVAHVNPRALVDGTTQSAEASDFILELVHEVHLLLSTSRFIFLGVSKSQRP